MAARGYAETQLGLIHFRAEGDGHPLVLIHQTPSSSAMYEPALPFLAKSFRAIAPDTAGYGMSDHVDRPPTMDDYARNVADVIDALGLDRPHIAGHHTGAAIAAETAAAYPDRVGRLVLSGAPLIDAADSRRWNTSFVREYPPREDGGHLLDAWRTMRERRPNDPLDVLDRRIVRQLMAGPDRSRAYTAVFAYDMAARLPLIKTPTLVLAGDQDRFLPMQDRVVDLLPDGRGVVIPGAGGDIVEDLPEAWSRTVVDFLSEA